MLNDEKKILLLNLAEEAIKGEEPGIPDESFLEERRGVFVTLKKNDELRGCMGLPYPNQKLGEGVIHAARNAGFKDPRFPAVEESELDEIEIEVSVLTQPEECELEDIKKGDGVILEKSGRTALFLPQVWDKIESKEAFLEQLSRKARLRPEDYKNAGYKKFQVQCFKK